MNNPFDYRPDEACNVAFSELVAQLENDSLRAELEAGKMLGVLIVEDGNGARHRLYAFSGQLGSGGFHHEGFVEPAFDYLDPNGYFKTHEARISALNAEIDRLECGDYAAICREFESAEARLNGELADAKERFTLSKQARDDRRRSESCSADELAAMVRQSQFEKAELRRLKKRLEAELEPFAARQAAAQSRLEAMKNQRRRESEALQQWLFSNFRLLNARGESKSLSEIFGDTPLKIPPSGAGECCAPKLLQAAYRRGLKPLAIAEYWYGRPKGGEVRVHGRHYPACRGKCGPVLGWMLGGLEVEPPLGGEFAPEAAREPEIVYENEWFCVVNKPGGMLSVPGKGAAPSVEQWLAERYGPERYVRMVHRLDQDTSGLLIAALDPSSYKLLQSLFATRRVRKTYVADLEGRYDPATLPPRGRISLALSADWLDRPRQRVDPDGGKEAVTDYEFTSTDLRGHSRVIFHPLTGRTHQLRLHAASPLGLGMPIVGDRLYGSAANGPADRQLHLHAQKIEFTFPTDGQHYRFECPAPF